MAQAQVSAYDQVYNAQIQLTMSEQQLEAAQYGQRASQLSLTEATMQASFQLQNYKSQLAGIAIQVQAAQVNIEAAKLALAETLGDPAATQIQRQQAQVSYEQAKQQYSSLLLQQSQLRQEYALASSLGVHGSQQVQAATQGVTSANYQLQDAHKQVATSSMMLDQAQVQSTQNVQMAQLQLTNAMRNQVFTIKQTALMLEMPIGAYGQLQSAMAALGPAGQQFVHWFMSSFYPILKQLEFGAEGALLPGIEKALTTMGPYFVALGKAFDQFDAGFGQFLGRIAAFISSKQGIIEFNAAMHSGLGFMQDMGQAILYVMKGFGQLAVVGAPATQAIGQAIVLLAQIFDQWAHSGAMKVIVTGFVDLVHVFDTLFKALGGAGGLGVLIMVISKFSGFGLVLGGVIAFLPQLMPLFRELMAIMAQLMTRVLGPMMPSLQQLAQLFAEGLAKALLQVMQIVVKLAPELITLLRAFTSFVSWLHPLIPLLLEVMIGFKLFTAAVWLMNIALDANPIGLIILAIGALGFAIFELATHWSTVWHAIVSAADWAWNWIYGNVLHPLWTFFGGPLIGGLNTLGSVFGGIWSGIVSVLQRAWSVIQPIFSGILQGVNTILGPLERLGSGVSTVFKDLGHVGGAVGNFIGHLFAEGGYVSSPTLGIVGEAGPEVVLPLTNRTRALELLTPLMAPGGALSMPSAGAAAGGGSAPVINIQTMSMADPEMIAQEVAWALKTQMAPGG
jgi:hypothetical protein